MSAKRQWTEDVDYDDVTSHGIVIGNDRATGTAKNPRLGTGWNSFTQYFMSILVPVVKLER